jgi:hypothetical protein
MGVGGCRLDGLVNVIREGGPRREGLKISPRIPPWSRFGLTMGTRGMELCFPVIREREVWEAGLHCTSLCEGGVGKDGVQVVGSRLRS